MSKRYSAFIVEGRGDFPHDMPRYDGCVPADAQDRVSVAITAENDPAAWRAKRRVRLFTLEDSPSAKRGPTVKRWESFGWKVIEVDGKPADDPIPRPIEATFLMDGHHTVVVRYYRDGDRCHPTGRPTCETCSLSWVMSEAAKFAVSTGTRKMTLDGATLERMK